MSKQLVLAEKPSVGRDLARVLGCHRKGNGFFEGSQYIVTWALGHLVTLADPETYDEKYKTWKLEDLPMLPTSLKLSVIKQTGKQFQTVKSQIARNDVKEIIIATDAGREGELVARWIIEKARIQKPIKRLWISSVTDRAIKEGFSKLRNGREYENLYASAVARSEADWYVGLNATRALTTKYNAQLSCGRVQTPTLAMIAKREDEIKDFRPKTYYGIKAQTEKLTLTWQDPKTKDQKSFDKDRIQTILTSLNKQKAELVDINKVSKKSFSPQLYDLTELQRDGHKLFGFSAKETLSIMQKLYEQHKLVTYPRTDSRYLSTDMVDTLKDRIEAVMIPGYVPLARKALTTMRVSKAFVDNSKVSDHHAIIPTEQRADLRALSDKERKIYDLIVKRFLAVMFPPYEYEQTTVTARIGSETFVARGKTVLSAGWKEVYGTISDDEEDERSEQLLPPVNKGDVLHVLNLSQTTGETKPPSRFNEGTLLSAMENPTKFMAGESKELIQTIGKTGGLGTVATRADIIEKLFNSFLLEQKGKEIFITNKGKQLLELVPEDLKSPALTAEWELKLELIAKGNLKKEKFITEIKDYAKTAVHEIKNSEARFKHDNMTGTKCPDCGKLMLEVSGKKGKMLVCQDRECGHRKNISKVTNARCPNCHKKLELRGQGDGQIFFCKCGHREKLSTFQERRKSNQNSKVSKHEVNKYLKKQDDAPVNTALADALAKLNLKK
ncbi:DNA topoisomerase-3 [Bacillus mesophilus]|uniref:DNA topoisomerase 3 n=1 Tax=Bacillus mesophilus TaxID=1808955 RepID=A0A6M0Q870_9BACI|nr:DNA topoisomerase III [Bacillus mesophilus]MBM7662100.1 DNA topoisomerase-3 [Bacillus mesophilus]NEY72546.1 DNA topoisomerase III [Bacillus mesophilus]